MSILRHELTRIARLQRLTLWRCCFAGSLATFAAVLYIGAAQNYGPKFGRRQVAEMTQYVTLALFLIEFILIGVLTPQWTADAIAGEKERQTLPFLLLTPLSNRAIILGKLAARLAQIGLFLLAGLPILAALQFLGGVGLDLILLGTAALAATVVSIASVSVLSSVYAKSPKGAARRAGQTLAAYFFGMIMIGQGLRAWPQIANFPSLAAPVTVHDVYDWLNIGNPITVTNWVIERVGAGAALPGVLASAVRDYVVFHALVSVGCAWWAIRRLRWVAATQGDGPPPPATSKLKQPSPRPPISERRPVTWKMLHCDQRLGKTNLQRTFARVVFVLFFLPLGLTIFLCLTFGTWQELPPTVNLVMRGLVTLGLCAALVQIAGQASASVTRERVKRTLDDLLLTDLTTREILGQKWLGAILGVRWFVVWAVLHWAVGIITGGLHPLAPVPLTVMWLVYACGAASLGLYCTVRWETMKQASLWASLIGFAAGIGPLLVAIALLAMMRQEHEFLLLPTMMSPPAALGISAVPSTDEVPAALRSPQLIGSIVTGAILGLLFHGGLAWLGWHSACQRFPRSVGRG